MALLLTKEAADKILSTKPEEFSYEDFLTWHQLYKDRNAINYTSYRKVDTRQDSNYILFLGNIIGDLLLQAEKDDMIVFRFICDSLENNFSGLNITPVIMDKKLTQIKFYSDVNGNGSPLNGQTEVLAKYYDVRKVLMDTVHGFRNETCGITYIAHEFMNVFGNNPQLSLYFMFDQFSAIRPKTNVAILEYNRHLTAIPDVSIIKTLKLYDNGGECC